MIEPKVLEQLISDLNETYPEIWYSDNLTVEEKAGLLSGMNPRSRGYSRTHDGLRQLIDAIEAKMMVDVQNGEMK